MLLISDGNSEISAHLCSEIGSSICLGHLCISTAVENFEPGFEIDLFLLHTCATCSELPFTIITMLKRGSQSSPLK